MLACGIYPTEVPCTCSKRTAVGVARIYHAEVAQKISVSYIAGSIHSCVMTCSHRNKRNLGR
jgi:hypothetical protein